MKVYELMNMLSEANAGADVKVSFSITAKEFLDAEPVDKDLKVFAKDIDEMQYLDEWNIDIEL